MELSLSVINIFNTCVLVCVCLVNDLRSSKVLFKLLIVILFAYLVVLCLCRKGYTVVINTWKRNDLLRRSVAHYASCAGVDSIHVVWSEPNLPQNSLIDSLKRLARSMSKGRREIEIKFDINQEDSLNNRFKEIKDLRTDAIYSIDDDVITPCSSLEFAYTVWNSAPSSMVGFVPRMHWLRDPAVYPWLPYELLLVAFVNSFI
jgi:Glycosyl transferase family 64 domain